MHEFLFGYYLLFTFSHLTKSESIQNEFLLVYLLSAYFTVYYLFQLSNFHEFIIP